MFDAFLVTWREFAEALLIIVLFRECFLRAGRSDMVPLIRKGLWMAAGGIAIAVGALATMAPDPAINALCTIAAAVSVAVMSIGVAASAHGLDKKVSSFVQEWTEDGRASTVILGMIVFLVLREGLELFVMLRSIVPVAGFQATLTGALLGLVAVGFTTRVWVWSRARFGLLLAFRVTAILLLALAVKMVLGGIGQLLHVRWLPIDHGYWLHVSAPFMKGGELYLWLYSLLFAPPLVYFIKSWWMESSRQRPGDTLELK